MGDCPRALMRGLIGNVRKKIQGPRELCILELGRYAPAGRAAAPWPQPPQCRPPPPSLPSPTPDPLPPCRPPTSRVCTGRGVPLRLFGSDPAALSFPPFLESLALTLSWPLRVNMGHLTCHLQLILAFFILHGMNMFLLFWCLLLESISCGFVGLSCGCPGLTFCPHNLQFF